MAHKISELIGTGNSRPTTSFPWPGIEGKSVEEGGKGLQVRIWAPGKDELDQAMIKAHKYFFKTLGLTREDLEIPEIYASWQSEIKIQQLWYAMRDPDKPEQHFASDVSKIRELDTDVQQHIFDHLVDWMRERSPIRELKTIEELEQVLVDLGKATPGAKRWLRRLDAGSLRFIAIELAGRLMSATKHSFSDISQSSDGSVISLDLDGSDPGDSSEQQPEQPVEPTSQQ